jgi:hypothetical protein
VERSGRQAGSGVAARVVVTGDYASELRVQARYHAQLTAAQHEVRRLASRLTHLDPVMSPKAFERTRVQLVAAQAALASLRDMSFDKSAWADDAL